MHKEPDWVSVDRDLEYEVRRRPRLDRLSLRTRMVRMDQRLVQVQDQNLALHQACKNSRLLEIEFIG